jgi:hypothetical protein
MDDKDVADLLAREVEKIGGVRKYASKHNLSYSYVSRVMNLKKPVTKKILDVLGLKITYEFKKKKRKPK